MSRCLSSIRKKESGQKGLPQPGLWLKDANFIQLVGLPHGFSKENYFFRRKWKTGMIQDVVTSVLNFSFSLFRRQ